MKCAREFITRAEAKVALFTRAWIEIYSTCISPIVIDVALFTRAWIEIFAPFDIPAHLIVALFTRAWIEI